MLYRKVLYRGEGEGVPLEERYGGDIDEDVLPCLCKEALLPHLYLDGVGGVFNHLDYNHVVEAADEPHETFNDVDDETAQHVLP